MSNMLSGLHWLSRVILVTTLLTVLLATGALGLRGVVAGSHTLSAATSHNHIQAGGLAIRRMEECAGSATPC